VWLPMSVSLPPACSPQLEVSVMRLPMRLFAQWGVFTCVFCRSLILIHRMCCCHVPLVLLLLRILAHNIVLLNVLLARAGGGANAMDACYNSVGGCLDSVTDGRHYMSKGAAMLLFELYLELYCTALFWSISRATV
jgi:hypothetical protein